MDLRIVLCPIDFSDRTGPEIALATEVCHAFGARLVLHHNVPDIPPGLARAWDWKKTHLGEDPSASAERRLQALLDGLPAALTREGALTSGPAAATVLTLARELPADLVVVGSHGWSTDEHASLVERLISQAPCSVLTLPEHDRGAPHHLLEASDGGRRAAVAVDLGPSTPAVLGTAFALAGRLSLDLDILHVQSDLESRPFEAAVDAEEAVRPLVPPALAARIRLHVRSGEPTDTILGFLADSPPAFLVIGSHARGFLARWLARDTARTVMHEASCPVWVARGPRGTGAANGR